MVREHHTIEGGQLPDVFGKGKSGMHPVAVRVTVAQSLPHRFAGARMVRKSTNSICMGMVHVDERDEGMHQRLDGRCSRGRLHNGRSGERRPCVVFQRLEFLQLDQALEIKSRKVPHVGYPHVNT